MSIKKVFFVFLFIKVVRSIKRYCFVRKYVAIPEQLDIKKFDDDDNNNNNNNHHHHHS